ncbi:UNVERIFIED_CONTAM: hypothetical protein GTU68_022941 [Idotea baltica]|nr:hypothetical protein [Idotea baltica]MCL4143014.1 hypothetical protein [Idotea baltica]
MEEGLLSLKWNNHKLTFFNLFQRLRQKGTCTDATLSCGHKFFNVHKLILMACSDFFCELFEHTTCQNPVVILKDVKSVELEALLDYMYIGEVEVQQKNLPEIIKAAESLRIKGLAVPDDGFVSANETNDKIKERPSKRKRYENRSNSTDERTPNSQPLNSTNKDTQSSSGDKGIRTQPQSKDRNSLNRSDLDYENSGIQSPMFGTNNLNFQNIKVEDYPELGDSPIKCEDISSDLASIEDYNPRSDISSVIDSCSDLSSNHIQSLAIANSETCRSNAMGQSDPFGQADSFSLTSAQSTDSILDSQLNSSESAAPFHCPYCPRIDHYESKWKRHLRTHTGEKPFSCPYCSYRASTKHCALRHIRFKHQQASANT